MWLCMPLTGEERCRFRIGCRARKHIIPRGILDSLDGPGGVLRDQRLVVQRRLAQRWQILLRPHVAERDTDVAQEATALDPLDRRAAKERAELLFIEREEITQPHFRDFWAGDKRALAGNLGEAVPRA